MATIQELRKHLRSIRSIEELSGAMRTAATVKYSRLNRTRTAFEPYADACADMLRLLGAPPHAEHVNKGKRRDCLVVLSGNRGLCGGFNTELLRFLEQELAKREAPLLLVSGRSAANWLRERSIPFEDFPESDVPTYEQLRPMSERMQKAYAAGECSRVLVIYQHFHNMMIQKPEALQLLPVERPKESETAQGPNRTLLYFPDYETVAQQLLQSCLDARLYALALEDASGAQAATMLSMRSAFDNAETAAGKLEVTINRRRQADITSDVIETASGAQGE